MTNSLALVNRSWIYSKRPAGRVTADNYQLHEEQIDDELATNEVLVAARYISVDPYMRIQQSARNTWEAPHPLGIVQRGSAVCQVLKSRNPKFVEGDWVLTYSGWQIYAKCHGSDIQLLDPTLASVTAALGVLGMPGRTAWFGLMESGRPKPGEVVVVSGAAGAVGSLVVQFAKRAGCRVFGIAGGASKCSFLVEKLGVDGVIDYKSFASTAELSEAIKSLTGGVDIYFDNVGGSITDALIPHINLRARIIICGAISQYDGGLDEPSMGPRFLQHLLFQRATIQGILARDYSHRMDEMLKIVTPWVQSGELIFPETIQDGFENLPDALNSLFEGLNLGKLIVRV